MHMTADGAKAVAEAMTAVWQSEVPATCKVLAAVKDDNRDYRPDPKSRTAWELATHLATADVWFLDSIISGTFAWDQDGAARAEARFTRAADIASFYEKEILARLSQIRAMRGEALAETIDFFGMITWPRAQFVGFATNHSVHHRGQLAAYLRPMGSRVPAIYGGSADEPMAAG
jgi:uncharacterized damage-inducible protein DinB